MEKILIALIVFWLPFLLSAITIWQIVLAGNVHKKAWLLALLNQALWLFWIILSASWGLLPMNFVLWYVCYQNHLKWNR